MLINKSSGGCSFGCVSTKQSETLTVSCVALLMLSTVPAKDESPTVSPSGKLANRLHRTVPWDLHETERNVHI